MAAAKISSISNTVLYFGDNSGQNTLTAVLDLSEISGNSNYKYAWFAYIGSDRENYYECVDPKKATSSQSTVTIDALTDAIQDFPSNSTTSAAYIEVVTYNSSGVEVGSHRKKFTAKLHSDVKPVAGDLIFNPANTANGYNILLSNLNAFSVKIGYSSWNTKGTAWQPTIGSHIVSYTIDQYVGNEVTSITKNTSKGYYHHKYPSVNIPHGKSLKYVITLKDARGRTCSVEKEYTNWRSYYRPIIWDLKAIRCTSNGVAKEDGQYILLTEGDILGLDVAKVLINNVNINQEGSFKFQLDENSIDLYGTTDSGIILNLGDTRSHSLEVEFTDAVGGSSRPYVIHIPGVQKIVNIRADGTGIAFGAKANYSNQFYCTWDIDCEGTITSSFGTCQNSDARLKSDIQDLDVNILDALRPVEYKLTKASDGKTHFGFIAQEVVSTLSDVGLDPESAGLLGHTMRDNQQVYTLAYTEFIPLIVKKCQELQKENNEMRAEIAEIKQLLLQASSE